MVMTSRNRFGSEFSFASSCHCANRSIGFAGALAINATFDTSIQAHFQKTTVFPIAIHNTHIHTVTFFSLNKRKIVNKVNLIDYQSESDLCVNTIVAE